MASPSPRGGVRLLLCAAMAMAGCGDAETASPEAAVTSEAVDTAPPVSAETASAETELASAAPDEVPDRPLLGALDYATTIYAKPSDKSARLGYLRVGAKVPRSEEPVSKRGCKGGWYQIEPQGFVCVGKSATLDMDDPLLRAASVRPHRDRPMPYRYGFVRSVLPLYLRVPTAQQQHKSEFKLGDHLEWFREHKEEIQSADLGAYDVAVDAQGRALPGKALGELGRDKNSSEMSLGELFGGHSDDDPWPFWLRDGERLIPNISGFDVPDYAVFADRARRHTGLAFVGTFNTDEHYLGRRFAITTDLRLAPTSKVKPDSGSPWHGVELGDDWPLPIAFVARRGAQSYLIEDGEARSAKPLKRRSVHKLTGKVHRVDGEKYVQLEGGRWAKKDMLALVLTPSKWPRPAKKNEKWVQVNIGEQTLTLWEGKKPVFATMVSTGRPQFGDWKETTAS
ncbi:MAG: L,D-transpeptidase, partial [Myxococcales bacterium]|nr:L,D-transpeptidase [Myxococcales bacterium]